MESNKINPESKLELLEKLYKNYRLYYKKSDMDKLDLIYEGIVIDVKKEIPYSIKDAELVTSNAFIMHHARCPICGSGINNSDDFRVCSTCGQALDWGNYDE